MCLLSGPYYLEGTTETTYDLFEHMCSVPYCLKGNTETTYDLFENMFSGPYFFKINTREKRNNLRFVCFPALICQKNNRNNLRFVKHTFA